MKTMTVNTRDEDEIALIGLFAHCVENYKKLTGGFGMISNRKGDYVFKLLRVPDYKLWMVRFKMSSSAVGDLAGDVCDDKSFPCTTESKVVYAYLKQNNACGEAIKAYVDSWKLYKEYLYAEQIRG